MTSTFTVVEKTPGGGYNQSVQLSLSERLTVRQLIDAYVDVQIAQYQSQVDLRPSFFIAAEDELILNQKTPSPIKRKTLDCDKLHARALSAFEENQYFILIDKTQAEYLDQELVISSQTQVTFLRLMPLVGG